MHAVLTGPTDTDMTRGFDIPKASAESVARAIFDGVESGEEDIFPDPMSQTVADGWRAARPRRSSARTRRSWRWCPPRRHERRASSPSSGRAGYRPTMPERRKVSIVGAGSVGATIAYACLIRGVAEDVALYDIDPAKVNAEVLDLNQGCSSSRWPT